MPNPNQTAQCSARSRSGAKIGDPTRASRRLAAPDFDPDLRRLERSRFSDMTCLFPTPGPAYRSEPSASAEPPVAKSLSAPRARAIRPIAIRGK